jgi:hypothetical protein
MTHRDHRASAARYAAGPALFATFAFVACSSSTAPPPEAYVNFTLGPHLDGMGNNYCSVAVAQQELLIGNPRGGTTPQTQADNSSQLNGQFDGNITVACAVTGGFNVVATGSLGGTMGGTVQLSGSVSAGSGGSKDIQASFTQNGTSYAENDCSITFTYEGGNVPVTPIAKGRIWGHLSCPTMVNPSTPKLLSNGTQVQETCDGEADFLFDNCAQQ